jgi:hypothetical protein
MPKLQPGQDPATVPPETPLAVARVKGSMAAAAAIGAYVERQQQFAVCGGLLARAHTLDAMLAKIIHDSAFKRLLRNPLGSARPWRDPTAIEKCNEQLIMTPSTDERAICKWLTKRARLYMDAHVFESAVRARAGLAHGPSIFHSKHSFVWRFCMRAKGA